ncbi:MAG TPA: carbohydrate ABC transporter permease [Aggregatilineales bacterium]|jgi:multiple sugar transport system permease protein|nr:carbohydrate ABC transporter permease [Aggregatilineales bacterium]
MIANRKFPNRMSPDTSARWIKLISYAVLIVGALMMVMPFVWSITTSLKPQAQLFINPPFWIPWPPDFSAYSELMERVNFGQYALNTLKVASLITIGQLITCSMAGYGFAKIKFPGRDKIFLLFLATMMVPAAVTLIPNFVVMRELKLVDTHAGLIIPFLGSAYGTFLLRQFYLNFPDELEEAAKLDGCNPFTYYLYILLPNSKAILSALGLLTFQTFWNEFQWSLIMINTESKRTLQVGLSYLLNENYINWPWLMAASVLTTLPILVLFFLTQKQFVQSVRFSGLKG